MNDAEVGKCVKSLFLSLNFITIGSDAQKMEENTTKKERQRTCKKETKRFEKECKNVLSNGVTTFVLPLTFVLPQTYVCIYLF
jgi:uncharacterized membrane protein